MTAPTGNTKSTLVSVSQINDFSFADPMVDVRGWTVLLGNGERVGVVDGMKVDKNTKRPLYLSVSASSGAGHMLLPIGMGQLARNKQELHLTNLTPETFAAIPRVTTEAITPEIERQVVGALTGGKDRLAEGENLHSHPLFDAARLFGGKPAATTS